MAPSKPDDPFREMREEFERVRRETEARLQRRSARLKELMRLRRDAIRDLELRFDQTLEDLRSGRKPLRRPRRKPPRGGSEPVTVEPNRPKLGEGGAAAPLEFDEP